MTNIYGYTITWFAALIVFTIGIFFAQMLILSLLCFLFWVTPTMAAVLILSRTAVVAGFILASAFTASPEGSECAESFKEKKE